jgi:hypothetical protein
LSADNCLLLKDKESLSFPGQAFFLSYSGYQHILLAARCVEGYPTNAIRCSHRSRYFSLQIRAGILKGVNLIFKNHIFVCLGLATGSAWAKKHKENIIIHISTWKRAIKTVKMWPIPAFLRSSSTGRKNI